MFYLIYKITNLINGKIYVGSHKTSVIDDDYMGSGKYLLHAQKKYGIENFKKEILFVFDNADQMYQKEAEIVTEEFLSEENTYNLKRGGFGGFDYINSTEKNLYGNNGKIGFGGENLRKSLTKNRMIQQGRYDEWRENISNGTKQSYASGRQNGFKNKRHSEETLNLLRGHTRQCGEKNSQFGTRWIHNPITKENKKTKGALESGWVYGKYKQPHVAR